MSALAEEPPRRISSFSPQVSQENGDRKPSLRELPSYRKEANQALNRREDLKSLSQVCDGVFEFDTKINTSYGFTYVQVLTSNLCSFFKFSR